MKSIRSVFSYSIFPGALLLASIHAHAHGPIASQAATAITRSVEIFLRDEPESIQKTFRSISSTLIGDERFKVEIALEGNPTDKRKMTYTCGLDTSVKPAKWGCKKD